MYHNRSCISLIFYPKSIYSESFFKIILINLKLPDIITTQYLGHWTISSMDHLTFLTVQFYGPHKIQGTQIWPYLNDIEITFVFECSLEIIYFFYLVHPHVLFERDQREIFAATNRGWHCMLSWADRVQDGWVGGGGRPRIAVRPARCSSWRCRSRVHWSGWLPDLTAASRWWCRSVGSACGERVAPPQYTWPSGPHHKNLHMIWKENTFHLKKFMKWYFHKAYNILNLSRWPTINN